MTEITRIRTAAETGLGELFERLKGSLPGDVAVREEALAGFAERGLPHRRVEEWKYTDLRALMREAAPLAERPSDPAVQAALGGAKALGSVEASRISFVNGHLVESADALPAGVEIVPLTRALTEGHPLLAELGANAMARDNAAMQLNTAFMNDGVLIRVAAGTMVSPPLHLRFVNAGADAFATATRVLVMVEAGASLTLLESHEGSAGLACQASDVVEFVAGDKAVIRHVRLNAESDASLALSTVTARLGAQVSFNTLNLVTGSAVARHQVFLTFAGEGSTARTDGAALLAGRQHADSTLVIDHAVSNCTSRELFKTVLDGESTGVYQGKVIVRPAAQKTDGGMKSDALLLADGASMYNKPELEIFADDVVCGHGATCGALDQDLLFYLKSRGLPHAEAESLLLQAFVGQAIEIVEHEETHDALIAVVEGWLKARA
jgi:Fe-S cluster assembly protein SufD